LFDQAQRRHRRRRADRIADFNAAAAGGEAGKALFEALSKGD
jgi:hypothetical protein